MSVARRRGIARMAAYVLIVVGSSYGFWRVEQVQHESCERGNELRSEDIPAAFESYMLFVDQEHHDNPAKAEDVARFRVVLDDLFPLRDC